MPTKTELLDNVERLVIECERREKRLVQIRSIIEAVDNRCMATDGPVTPTLQEMTAAEMQKIFALACGRKS